jgi:uncharacterized protein (TIGR03083 family)
VADKIWDTIRPLRLQTADYLDTLTPEQWAMPSLCGGWSVKDVAAHLVGGAMNTPGHFFGGLIGSGFSFNKFVDKDIATYGAGSPADVVKRLRDVAPRTTSPPGPTTTMLGENIVHPEDIRRAVGSPSGEYPADALIKVLDFYKGSNLIIGSKRRIAGLTLRATDLDWTTGSGPEVAGPAIGMVMAMTGRKAYLDDLKGDGVETLRSRS